MNKAFTKWGILFSVGVCLLAFTAVAYIQKNYTWIFASGFLGLFLVSSSWKRIRFLLTAKKMLEAGEKEIVIHYRDKNLKESESSVIPAGADAFWFYGYLPEKKDIKAFRWERIKKATENGIDLKKDDILERI